MLDTKNQILIAITTVAKISDAKTLSMQLVENKLAACVQIDEIFSIYNWNNETMEDTEFRLMIKSSTNKQRDIVSFLSVNHPYDTPEIIFTSYGSSDKYYDWVVTETR